MVGHRAERRNKRRESFLGCAQKSRSRPHGGPRKVGPAPMAGQEKSFPPPWRAKKSVPPHGGGWLCVRPSGGRQLSWPRSQAPAWERALLRSSRFADRRCSEQSTRHAERAVLRSGASRAYVPKRELGNEENHFAAQSIPQKSFVATSPRLGCCNKLKRILIGICVHLAILGLGRNSGASGDFHLTRPSPCCSIPCSSIRRSRKSFLERISVSVGVPTASVKATGVGDSLA